MKKFILIVSLVSALLLTGCNKNEKIEGNNVKEYQDNKQQEVKNDNKNSDSYSNEQLIEMVKTYRNAKGEYIPDIIEVDGEDGNIVTIHLYEIIDEHMATSDWYYIDRTTGIGEDFNGESINLNINNIL